MDEAARREADEYERRNAEQRAYFERGETTRYMLPTRSPYVMRQVEEVVRAARLRPGEHVLDAGCGMGRYTFPLAERGVTVEGLDFSQEMLDRVRDFDGKPATFPLHRADLLDPPEELRERFDAVVGFFTLHHVPDVERCLEACATLVKPGGRIAFVEPNPYNVLFYVQMALAPGMSWSGERGIVKMRGKAVLRTMERVGLQERNCKRFGFLPPALVNRPRGRALERRLERLPPLERVLPFQLFVGVRPEG